MAGKQSSSSDHKRQTREERDSTGWGRGVRIVVSLLIVWHLSAVFIGPFAVPPTSRTVLDLARSDLFAWYMRPLYLDNGYGFFAPDPPGSSELIHYRVTRSDGTVIEGEFPDYNSLWPRLRNHRYMMLAAQSSLTIGRETPEERIQAMLVVYCRQLLREYDGARAEVVLKYHDVMADHERFILEELKLDDPRSFREVYRVTQSSNDLGQPIDFPHLRPRESDWQTGGPPRPRSGP